MAALDLELLAGHSQALYSTWLWYRPFRLLCDAGEGVALRLQNSVFAVRWVLLSHGHLDHVGGLPGLLNIRHNGMGDNAQPLSIAYPAGDVLVRLMQEHLARTVQPAGVDLEWRPLLPGERWELEHQRSVVPFATRHIAGQPSLGYRVVEARRRLRAELRGESAAAIRELVAREGRDAVTESFDHPLLVYGGDGLTPSPAELRDAEVACLEATFLDAADRGRPTHATVAEAVRAAKEADVRRLVLFHISGRYRFREAVNAIRQATRQCGYGRDVVLLWRERLVPVIAAGRPLERLPRITADSGPDDRPGED
ncbi:MAG: MBL fold metallo-hydrolase [Fimbriimonadaceae bacterium]|nr:MBL fold metallo-hydrolase [Fimbriimonadaceae bacterium]